MSTTKNKIRKQSKQIYIIYIYTQTHACVFLHIYTEYYLIWNDTII